MRSLKAEVRKDWRDLAEGESASVCCSAYAGGDDVTAASEPGQNCA